MLTTNVFALAAVAPPVTPKSVSAQCTAVLNLSNSPVKTGSFNYKKFGVQGFLQAPHCLSDKASNPLWLPAASGECIDIGNIAKDCAVDCLLSMLPIPDPCGRFGKLFSAAIGICAGLANSFEQDTLVHTRILLDSGYQTKLKAIKDIQVGDEVLAKDELQAHDNAAMAQSGQATQTLQAAYQQDNLSNKSAAGAINTGASSYQEIARNWGQKLGSGLSPSHLAKMT